MGKIIAVGSSAARSLELVRGAAEASGIEEASSLEEALEKLQDPQYAGVVIARQDALRLKAGGESARGAGEAHGILEEEVCIVGRSGSVVWGCARCREGGSAGHCDSLRAQEVFRSGQRHVVISEAGGNRYCEYSYIPIPGSSGDVEYVVYIKRDVTEQVHLKQKIDAIYRAGNELMSIDRETMSRLDLGERTSLIKRNIVEYTRDLFDYDYFMVLLLDEKTGQLHSVISEGVDQDTMNRLSLFARTEGSGTTGYVAATGEPYLCEDASKDPLFIQVKPNLRSSVTVPLRLKQKVIGVFNAESEHVGAFGSQDLHLLDMYASYVATALGTAMLLETDHTATVDRLSHQLAHEINNPLNAILNNVHLLLAEYIGHDVNTTTKLKDIEHHIERVKGVISHIADVDSPQFAATAAAPRSEELQGKRLLIADDDIGIRESVAEILGRNGCIVDTAVDGLDAVEKASRQHYDAVLADIRMPKLNGYEVFAEISKRSPSVPVILMTAFGYDPRHSIVRARKEGLQLVLFKPFKVDMLMNEIRKALQLAGHKAQGAS